MISKPRIKHAAATLFGLACCFPFLSASVAAQIGADTLRVVIFSGLIGGCVLLAFVGERTIDQTGFRTPLLLISLLISVALIDVSGDFNLFDYKIILPVLLLVAAANLDRVLEEIDIGRLFFRILTVYVAASGIILLAVGRMALSIGTDDFPRLDVTGSVVAHSSFCLIFIIAGSVSLERHCRLASAQFLLLLPIIILAFLMMMLAATRTVVVTGFVYVVLYLATNSKPLLALRRLLPATLLVIATITIYSYFVDDTLLLRLIGEQGDFSSGRSHSLNFWLSHIANYPFGSGLGYVRELLSDGRLVIENGRLLEWPHNEFIRFLIEAGPIGLAFVILLCGTVISHAVQTVRLDGDPFAKTLALAIAADMIARSMLQNYFNNVYEATILVAVVALLSERARRVAPGFSGHGNRSENWPWLDHAKKSANEPELNSKPA